MASRSSTLCSSHMLHICISQCMSEHLLQRSAYIPSDSLEAHCKSNGFRDVVHPLARQSGLSLEAEEDRASIVDDTCLGWS